MSRWRGHHDKIKPRDVFDEIVEIENAFGLVAAALADGEQAREASPRGAVLRVGENVGRAVGEHEPRPDDEFQRRDVAVALRVALADFRIQFLDCRVGTHHAGNAVAIRDADAGMA